VFVIEIDCLLCEVRTELCNLVSCSTSKAFLFSPNVLSLTDKNSSGFDGVGKTHYVESLGWHCRENTQVL